MGQGCLSDLHPLMIGQTGFWGLEFTHSLTKNADIILALGTRFGEADSSSWYQGVTFDPDVGHYPGAGHPLRRGGQLLLVLGRDL